MTGVRLLLIAAALGGCVAPMGVGPGPRVPDRAAGAVSAGGGAGFGATGSRELFQVDGSARFQPRDAISLEAGFTYNTLRDRDDGRTLIVHSAMPWARPTIYVRGFSLGVALLGLGFGGGGGGFGWGMIEPRIGYGRDRWSVYAAWLRHGAIAVGGGGDGGGTTEVSSEHWRVGGDYDLTRGWMRLGLAASLTRGDDCILHTQGSGDGIWAEQYTMLMLALRVTTHGR
jgi:hypothetical protein